MKRSLKALLAVLCTPVIFLAAGCAPSSQEDAFSSGSLTFTSTADTAVTSVLVSDTTTTSSSAPAVDTETSSAAAASTAEATQTAALDGIDLQAAINAALTHAGLTEDQITLIKTKSDRENGVSVYDIEFRSSTMHYEYDVNAANGEIVSFSAEQIPKANSQSPSESVTPAPEYISEAEARAAALQHAGLTEEQVTFIKTKLDYDDGKAEYDVEFTSDSAIYEYEIRAADGKVLEFSNEALPSAGDNQGSSDVISEEEAKAIALTCTGFTEDKVTFTEVKFDYDDGIPEYEIEFRVGGLKYEVKINASSGSVIETDIDD